MLGPGVSPGEELVEHIHRLIDGVAVALPEETDQRREASWPGDLAQPIRRTLADEVEQGPLVVGVQPGEVDGQNPGGLDGGELVGKALHGGRRGLGRVGLDRLEAGNRLPFLHFQEIVEGLRHARCQALGQLGNDVFAGPLPLLSDQTQQRRLGREQDVPLLEELAGTGQERGRLLQAARFLEDEAFQGFHLFGVEDDQLEVVTDTRLMIRDRMLPGRVSVDAGRVDVQLRRDEAQQFVADLQGLLSREAAEQTNEADLIGEPQAVVVTATLGDLDQVGFGQGRFADHLSP